MRSIGLMSIPNGMRDARIKKIIKCATIRIILKRCKHDTGHL